jgi:hypothetical protein
LSIALIWSLGIGLTALWVVGRWRGFIGRTACLLIGCAGASSFPTFAVFAKYTVRKLVFMDARTDSFAGDFLGFLTLSGLVAIPFGVAGRWLIWRLAVRPAAMKTDDIATTFD